MRVLLLGAALAATLGCRSRAASAQTAWRRHIETFAVGAAIEHLVQSPPLADHPRCLGAGYGARDTVATRYYARMLGATQPPPAGEASDLACGGAWRSPGATESTAVALRLRNVAVKGTEYRVSFAAWQANSTLSAFEVRLALDWDEFRVLESRPIYR